MAQEKHRPTVEEAYEGLYDADECGQNNTPEFATGKNIVLRKADVKIGDTLTLKAETYGQSFVPYAKTRDEGIKSVPNKIITPGMVGIVASVDVPSPTHNRSFICLDFIVDGITYRTRPGYDEVKPVKAERPEAHQFCGVWYAGKE